MRMRADGNDKGKGRSAYIEDVFCELEPTDKLNVYLVAGTWGAGFLKTVFPHFGQHGSLKNSWPTADWTEEGSTFVREARGRLPGANIRRLVWGGRNRSSDRQSASETLAEEIRNHPDREKIIVCHSHAGNIALNAISECSKGVRGIVCLNTPFFNPIGRNAENTMVAGVFSTLFAMLALIYLWEHAHYCLFGLGAAGIVVSWAALVKGKNWFIAHEERFAKRRSIEQTRFLCLTTYEDEAFAVLNLADALGNLPFLFVGKWSPWLFAVVATTFIFVVHMPSLGEVGEPLDISSTSMLVALGLTVIVLVISGYYFRQKMREKWHPLSFGFVALFAISPWLLSFFGYGWKLAFSYLASGMGWGAFAVLCLIALTLPAILLSNFLAQGNWNPVAPYFVRNVVSLTPLEARRVKFVVFPPTESPDLNHAMLHGAAQVTWGQIAEWLNEESSGI